MAKAKDVDATIRALSAEMAKDKDAAFIGKTEAEMEVLAHYAHKGRNRAAVGAMMGSSVMAGLWKISKNQRMAAGAFAMLSGALFGASYGIISIRRDMFSDLLMLPSEKSPFATRARSILMTKMPENPFVQEINDKFKHSAASTDSWTEKVAEPGTRRLDNEIRSSIPPITGLDTPRGKEDRSDWQQEDQESFNDSGSRSPFFFGAKPPSSEDDSNAGGRDASRSRDPYAHDSRASGRPGSDKKGPPLRHDEDDYFFGEPSDSDSPEKATTWEEIRRRAAEQRK